jgi:hypothetical protein
MLCPATSAPACTADLAGFGLAPGDQRVRLRGGGEVEVKDEAFHYDRGVEGRERGWTGQPEEGDGT